MANFTVQTIMDAQKYLKRPSKDAKSATLFYQGDHWQRGEGWMGPAPIATDKKYNHVMPLIKKGFVSKNVIKEIVTRHVAGVIGREPLFRFVPRDALPEDQEPTEEDQRAAKVAEAALTSWWNKRKIHKQLRDSLYRVLTEGRQVYRLFIPRGRLDEGGWLSADSLEEALDHIFLDVPDTSKAAVGINEDFMQEVGVYVYTDDQGQQFAEVTYVDEEGLTVLHRLGRTRPTRSATGTLIADTLTEEPIRLDLQGNLWIQEITRDALISPQIMVNQKAVNLGESMRLRNIVLAGFLERVVTNAQVPGKVDRDPETGREVFTPEPYQVGPGTTNFVQGVTIPDPTGTGKITIANPGVIFRDPVNVDTFDKTGLAYQRAMLEEAHQVHALISGDATPSGESRVQARADFANDLLMTSPEVTSLVAWLLETALYIATYIVGTTEVPIVDDEEGIGITPTLPRSEITTPLSGFGDLRCDVIVRLDTGPLTADERRIVLERYEKGTLSLETTMALLGTDDTDGELSRIRAERENSIPQLTESASLAQQLVMLSGTDENLLLMAKFNEEQAKLISEADFETADEEGGDNPDDQEEDDQDQEGEANNDQEND